MSPPPKPETQTACNGKNNGGRAWEFLAKKFVLVFQMILLPYLNQTLDYIQLDILYDKNFQLWLAKFKFGRFSVLAVTYVIFRWPSF
jgi:hypothetical protein